MHLESASFGLHDSHHPAQTLSRATLEAEVTQRDATFLAQLEQRESHIEVEGKVVLAHLIEHRRGALTIGERAEFPSEVLPVAR